MNRPGDELLPYPRLAFDEHRGIDARDVPNLLLHETHRRAPADQAVHRLRPAIREQRGDLGDVVEIEDASRPRARLVANVDLHPVPRAANDHLHGHARPGRRAVDAGLETQAIRLDERQAHRPGPPRQRIAGLAQETPRGSARVLHDAGRIDYEDADIEPVQHRQDLAMRLLDFLLCVREVSVGVREAGMGDRQVRRTLRDRPVEVFGATPQVPDMPSPRGRTGEDDEQSHRDLKPETLIEVRLQHQRQHRRPLGPRSRAVTRRHEKPVLSGPQAGERDHPARADVDPLGVVPIESIPELHLLRSCIGRCGVVNLEITIARGNDDLRRRRKRDAVDGGALDVRKRGGQGAVRLAGRIDAHDAALCGEVERPVPHAPAGRLRHAVALPRAHPVGFVEQPDPQRHGAPLGNRVQVALGRAPDASVATESPRHPPECDAPTYRGHRRARRTP
jgi:hypothetical protein